MQNRFRSCFSLVDTDPEEGVDVLHSVSRDDGGVRHDNEDTELKGKKWY